MLGRQTVVDGDDPAPGRKRKPCHQTSISAWCQRDAGTAVQVDDGGGARIPRRRGDLNRHPPSVVCCTDRTGGAPAERTTHQGQRPSTYGRSRGAAADASRVVLGLRMRAAGLNDAIIGTSSRCFDTAASGRKPDRR